MGIRCVLRGDPWPGGAPGSKSYLVLEWGVCLCFGNGLFCFFTRTLHTMIITTFFTLNFASSSLKIDFFGQTFEQAVSFSFASVSVP